MNVLQLLTKTRELLSSPAKWVKQSLHKNGGYCLVGALQWAAKGQTYNEDSDDLGWVYDQATTRCQLAIWEKYEGQEWDLSQEIDDMALPAIPGWNDDDEREHHEILATLDRAIKLELTVAASMEEDS